MDNELNEMKAQSLAWLKNNLNFYRMDSQTIEVETPLIDSFGQNIYCFIIKKDEYYLISDGGWFLFKLDPDMSDLDFYNQAVDIIIGTGFEIDEETGEFFMEVSIDELPLALNQLAQLQVALSYLK
ncbi:DUF1828 domain-containing protein [Lactobacillus iners]|uniref:DUF1828 domain-containing protein n=1 Tax=Lactobacillus iners TaxID=147802 RepID=UPI00254B77AA|nr:DUF1828 domain-containing protein [Lactobacillus iners]MDK8131097.1 DUF1828 domain-containing protein [Lactobacillus iners]